MIIVSQDKETIINFDGITRMSIIPPAEEGYKCSIAINGCLDLGYYKTKERAKEVLKEITNIYLDCNNDFISTGYGYVKNNVYEMPED